MFIIIILIIFALISLLSYYLYYENNKLQTNNYLIVNERIPKEFNNYKIVQISDFHNTKSKKLINDLVRELKNIKPNIIVLTGDFIDPKKSNIDAPFAFIKKIKDIAPIYFIAGNHEAIAKNYDELKDKLIQNNVIILNNKALTINIQNAKINLLGIFDPLFNYHTCQDDATIINNSIQTINYDYNNFSILLSHRPELFAIYVEANLDIVLTGHAHGGQIRIPFIGGLVAPNQGLFPKYTSGEFKKNKTTMIVSRGIGNSIFPFRINNRPELVVLNLYNK